MHNMHEDRITVTVAAAAAAATTTAKMSFKSKLLAQCFPRVSFIFSAEKVPCLKVPCRGIHLYNSSDILRYLYGAFLPKDPKMVEFLKPTKEAVELEAKIDQFALDCRRWDFIFFIVREIASCV